MMIYMINNLIFFLILFIIVQQTLNNENVNVK